MFEGCRGRFETCPYYERVISKECELDQIRQYIAENPAGWSEDPENLAVRGRRDTFG